jgi:hypothetical protein
MTPAASDLTEAGRIQTIEGEEGRVAEALGLALKDFDSTLEPTCVSTECLT